MLHQAFKITEQLRNFEILLFDLLLVTEGILKRVLWFILLANIPSLDSMAGSIGIDRPHFYIVSINTIV